MFPSRPETLDDKVGQKPQEGPHSQNLSPSSSPTLELQKGAGPSAVLSGGDQLSANLEAAAGTKRDSCLDTIWILQEGKGPSRGQGSRKSPQLCAL